jgi:2,3-bisphosphoglycerate-dependent phosphoglycerate mutase
VPFVRALFVVAALFSAVASTFGETVVVLVRHGEKVDDSVDAQLSEKGKARAQALGALLKDAGIDAVYSTDFTRTRETARPTAERISKPVEIYNTDDLGGFAKRLRARGGRALVVGHSNTTPELVRLLGGDAGPPIDDGEYDRLYLLVLSASGETTTTILRFSP